MNTIFTAVTISVFIMMGCTLFVLIWEMIDNKRSVVLEKEIYQQVITFLGKEDKLGVSAIINEAMLNYLERGD